MTGSDEARARDALARIANDPSETADRRDAARKALDAHFGDTLTNPYGFVTLGPAGVHRTGGDAAAAIQIDYDGGSRRR